MTTPATVIAPAARFSWPMFVAGMLLNALGAIAALLDYKLAKEAKEQAHMGHLAITLGIAAIGIVIAFSPYVLPTLKQLLGMASSSNLPVIGRKPMDPPGANT